MQRSEYERDVELILDWESWRKGKRMWIYELWKLESEYFCKYGTAFLYYLFNFYLFFILCWSRDEVQGMGSSSCSIKRYISELSV